MGARWQDHARGGPTARASQRRSGRRAPPRQPPPAFILREGDRVRWGGTGRAGIERTGVVTRILPGEIVEVIQDRTARLWVMPVGSLARCRGDDR